MSAHVKKHLSSLKLLRRVKPGLRRKLLSTANNELIACICECCHNILKGNIKLSSKQRKLLCRHRNPIRALASRKLSLKKKRQLLVQKGGFLPAVLGPIIAAISGLVGGLLNR